MLLLLLLLLVVDTYVFCAFVDAVGSLPSRRRITGWSSTSSTGCHRLISWGVLLCVTIYCIASEIHCGNSITLNGPPEARVRAHTRQARTGTGNTWTGSVTMFWQKLHTRCFLASVSVHELNMASRCWEEEIGLVWRTWLTVIILFVILLLFVLPTLLVALLLLLLLLSSSLLLALFVIGLLALLLRIVFCKLLGMVW